MKRISIVGLAFVSVLSWAAEIVVTPSAREGSGEFASIQAALHVAKAGDVVTVRAGVYRENLSLAKAYEGAPLTVRAAAGERVVVSGFVPIEGWKAVGGGVYSASVEAEVRELYVGLQEQQCGRWPEDGTRRAVLQADGEAKVFRTEPATDVPHLAELEKDPKGAIVFYYHARANAFGTGKLGHYDRGTGEIGFAEGSWNRWLGAEGNQFALMNHPALVRKPGDWAFVSEGALGGTVYFYPKAEADLRATRHRPVERPLLSIGHWKDRVGNVIVDGLEFMGSGAEAVKISADDVVVRNCVIHHNANGVGIRGANRIRVESNIIVANGGNGLSLASVNSALIEGNEIAYNVVDGLVIAGNISGRKSGTPGANPPTRDVVARRNYIHHHILQAHPDNIQMYRDVANVKVEENFVIWGGQSLMAEEAEEVEVCGNVVMASGAVMFICGHGNSHRWTFRDNTLWGAGYGFFSFTGRDYLVERNVFVGGPIPYGKAEAKVVSRNNYFVPKYEGKTHAPWRTYSSLEGAKSELGQEMGSQEGVIEFGNFPVGFANASAHGSATESIAMRKGTPDGFAQVGDRVELNGDGVLRTVTSFSDGVLSFEPALPLVPFRGVLVANWKAATSVQMDNRPLQKGFGAQISTVDFVKGDLLGKGERTLPPLPKDVQEAIPDPNNVVVPLVGS